MSPRLLRYVRIGMAVALMAAVVVVVGESLREETRPAALPLVAEVEVPSVPVESGVFRRMAQALAYLDTPETPPGGRTLETFYALRAYPGAPPSVPHPLADATSYGNRTCLACHAQGGWVPDLEAYAPVTPHPELASCLMCHVPMASGRPTVAAAGWHPMEPPPIRRVALPGGPPPVPHSLQMRENCLACHAGPAAVAEIRTTHPERVNCRQCHVLAVGSAAFAGAVDWQVP